MIRRITVNELPTSLQPLGLRGGLGRYVGHELGIRHLITRGVDMVLALLGKQDRVVDHCLLGRL